MPHPFWSISNSLVALQTVVFSSHSIVFLFLWLEFLHDSEWMWDGGVIGNVVMEPCIYVVVCGKLMRSLILGWHPGMCVCECGGSIWSAWQAVLHRSYRCLCGRTMVVRSPWTSKVLFWLVYVWYVAKKPRKLYLFTILMQQCQIFHKDYCHAF